LQRLLTSDVNCYEDITQPTIDFIRFIMDRVLRNSLLAN